MPDAPLPLLKPELYAVGSETTPHLLGGRCECGHIFFPMQTYGCERCGSTALRPVSLAGHGRLRAVATVHVHADATRSTPFVIGTIALDDGPIVRTLLTDALADRDALGTAVEAVLVPITTADGAEHLDLRFQTSRRANA